uniref:Uncharacterized protein n=1 Tax=Avena sativa TaxID=4498 RepID=A0ACD5U9C8_AVESA
MTPSATHHRPSPRADAGAGRRRCCRNAPSGIGQARPTATARALAAGLWRLRHAERHAVIPNARRRHVAPHSPRHRRKAKLSNISKTRCGFGVGFQCRNHSILDKIDACAVEMPYGCSMEKATKWDQHVCLHNTLGSHVHHHARATAAHAHATVVALEAEIEKALAHIAELEDEKRAMRKKVKRFLKRLAEEKASWKSRAREVMATLKEDAKAERNHRRQLEAANRKLMKELAEAKASAKQAAQSYEMERKAREMMEEACEELTKEVEEDQGEVELLRRECLGMREEMEEERRMLQMAEVWREERVQMKLSDAKLALEQKYSQLNRLQAEMESFLRKDGKSVDASSSALREARMISEAASSVRPRGVKELSHQNPHTPEEVDRVFQHYCRKDQESGDANGGSAAASPAASNVHSVSPATDIFLEKLDGDGSVGWDSDRRRDSCSSAGTSTDRSVARAGKKAPALSNGSGSRGGSGVTDPPDVSRMGAPGKNTALIRRLWRSAISESRKVKTAGSASASAGTPTTQAPSSEQRSTVITPTLPVEEQCSSSYSVKPQQQQQERNREAKGLAQGGGSHKQKQKQKQSLQEKLMEARLDDHNKPLHCSAAKQKQPCTSYFVQTSTN